MDSEEENMIARGSRNDNSRQGRRTVWLGVGLEKSLSAYASAAAAAGVSLLAITRSAEARVIYTPAHTNIPFSGRGREVPVLLDLNHDGIADFSFWNGGSLTVVTSGHLLVGCAGEPGSRSSSTCRNQGNEIWGRGGGIYGRFASALRPGFKVGANKSYFHPDYKRYHQGVLSPIARMASFLIMNTTYHTSFTSGQWLYTKHRYLGLRFIIKGQVHFGRARVAVTVVPQAGISATLTGYAYETIPNKPIFTGKTKGPDVITLEPATLEAFSARSICDSGLATLTKGATVSHD
jgi:hypothetical protein